VSTEGFFDTVARTLAERRRERSSAMTARRIPLRRGGAMVVLLLAVALSQSALPAGATKPFTSSRMDVSVPQGCQFDVSYSWTAYRGKNLSATIDFYERGSPDLLIGTASSGGYSGKGGTFSHTFVLALDAPNLHVLFGRGRLESGGTLVSGSESSTLDYITTCKA
jgi:hypothetical protein